ncbi:glutamic acid-rich protein-like [Haliotis rufescens]|uniref:glutamic acid-rich protein-like n=1 Tax=Haliotis rufescens TaxID=6454 RepID=UPI00201F7850|nr:glutamic acid-rich protein-like [Haliotis rufescens]
MKWYLLAACVVLIGQGEAKPVENGQPGGSQNLFRSPGQVTHDKEEHDDVEQHYEDNDDVDKYDEEDDEDDEEEDEGDEEDDEHDEEDDEHDEEDEDDEDEDEDEDDEDHGIKGHKGGFLKRHNLPEPKNWGKMTSKEQKKYIKKYRKKICQLRKKSNDDIQRKAKKMKRLGDEIINDSHDLERTGQKIRSKAVDVLRSVKSLDNL